MDLVLIVEDVQNEVENVLCRPAQQYQPLNDQVENLRRLLSSLFL